MTVIVSPLVKVLSLILTVIFCPATAMLGLPCPLVEVTVTKPGSLSAKLGALQPPDGTAISKMPPLTQLFETTLYVIVTVFPMLEVKILVGEIEALPSPEAAIINMAATKIATAKNNIIFQSALNLFFTKRFLAIILFPSSSY